MAICDSKLCHSCKEIKSITEFTKCSKSKDGLQRNCKQCDRARLRDAYTKTREKQIAKAKTWNSAHKDEKREYKRKYNKEYVTNNSDRLKEYIIKYREDNADTIKQKAKDYRLSNIEKFRERDAAYHKRNRNKRLDYLNEWRKNNQDRIKEWAANNKERIAIYSRNRRARKKLSPERHTKDDVLKLLELQSNQCAVCKCSVKNRYHVDHIYPLSSGGSNGKENLQILCPGCNLSKHNKHPIDFMNQQGFLL